MSATILIADDHELLRRGLRATLEERPEWQIVAEVANGRDAVAGAEQLKPDVAILDITMPELNGLEATRQIHTTSPSVAVLILTIHESEQVVKEVLDAGAQGYLLKSDAGRNLIYAVEAMLEKKPYFTTSVARMVLNGYLHGCSPADAGETPGTLSPREREIVQMLAEGKTTKGVARVLGISAATAETHRTNIMRKLDFHSVAELVRYAIRNRIMEA